MVSVLSLHSKIKKAYFPFDSYIPGSSSEGCSFIFQKTKRSLKCACYSVGWMITEWWMKCDWNPPFPSPFIRHSATIQSPLSRLKGEISSCARPHMIWQNINILTFNAIKQEFWTYFNGFVFFRTFVCCIENQTRMSWGIIESIYSVEEDIDG